MNILTSKTQIQQITFAKAVELDDKFHVSEEIQITNATYVSSQERNFNTIVHHMYYNTTQILESTTDWVLKLSSNGRYKGVVWNGYTWKIVDKVNVHKTPTWSNRNVCCYTIRGTCNVELTDLAESLMKLIHARYAPIHWSKKLLTNINRLFYV